MIFDDIFYPGNPKRREEIAYLHGTIKAQFTQYKLAWNAMASTLSSALSEAGNPNFNFSIKQLSFDIDSSTISEATSEINSVLVDTRQKLDKVVSDTGIIDVLPENWGSTGFEFDGNISVLQYIEKGLAGVASIASAFVTWYIYQGVQLVVTLINIGGAMIGRVAAIAGGALGGLIVGAAAFIVTDIVVSAIFGALERDKLNDAIDLLTKIKAEVGDKLSEATPKVAGITQNIKDGLYKLDKNHILVLIDKKYVIMETPKTQYLKSTSSGLQEGKIIYAFA